MVHSDVIKNGWDLILPVKKKYTKRDVDTVLLAPLFDRKVNNGATFTPQEARFIVLCTSIINGAEISKRL